MMQWLAQNTLLAENNFGDTRSGGLAGPTGLVIILLLVVGTILLIRNMNSRLRRLPERFEPERYGPPAGYARPRAPERADGDGAEASTPDGPAAPLDDAEPR